MSKQHDLDKETLEWITKQDELMDEGNALIREASNEALEYMTDAIENISDKQWRKMAVESQAVEMGVGVAMAEHLVPKIYDDLTKKLHKKIKVNKETARALRHIYIGRVVKNVRRKLNEREQ